MHFARNTVFVCIICGITLGAPVTDPTKQLTEGERLPSAVEMQFMQNFGYLDKGIPNAGALYRKEAIVDAIKLIQKFGAIPETGLLDNATQTLMQSQRCGVPDVIRDKEVVRRKRFILGTGGWKKRDITYFLANWSPKVGERAIVDELRRAFDAWSGYARLKFRQVQDSNADIIIFFGRGEHGDGYSFDGPGNILAHAFFPYEMDHFGGDIHFDEDENWRIKKDLSESGIDFFTVAVHELGHSLGLSHSPDTSSVMFPYYKDFLPYFQLGYDDILGMYQLYISQRLEGDDQATSGYDNTEPTVTQRTTRRPVVTTTPKIATTTPRINYTFTGDDETVDHHKTHDEKHGIPESPLSPTTVDIPDSSPQTGDHNDIPGSQKPTLDICQGNFDALAVLRGELFVFKNELMWRLSSRGKVQKGYPVPFRQMFWKLPKSIKKIDAVYQRNSDESIILFTGNLSWVYDGSDFIEGSPRPLTYYGIPSYIEKIDAVQVWKKNGKTFFYSGDRYWRYNETMQQMDPGYPKSISRWKGVPSNLDAAMTWTDGYTYFFQGLNYWRFDNINIRTVENYPYPAPQYWLGCPEKLSYAQRT